MKTLYNPWNVQDYSSPDFYEETACTLCLEKLSQHEHQECFSCIGYALINAYENPDLAKIYIEQGYWIDQNSQLWCNNMHCTDVSEIFTNSL